MDSIDGHSELLAVLGESLCRDADIEFAVVFGSQLTSNSRPSSDLDLAVKFTKSLSSHERFQKLCFLSGDLQREGAPFIDLSDIETLPLEVAHDAVNGEFLCGDEDAFRHFKADTESLFEEQHEDIRRHQRDVIDRIAEDGLHG
ncbi:nucleotidyltransferase domain-containing protein [Haladaptatus sp. AB643]|uniref:type VII toxin-antitoxin system MntA family adenylyltransferase antitoxin n=1 Tax=Haladaptatus sp. AB643 TaxID=2934174 RepID=UPI00209C167C|nr:nucleotidyltransferase domain-containing protein [Haladaptatus sp. AB643]MCO8245335.1 nucleotidyltransferase domain-containing protein [Haladaptatus sp. AB643]